MESMAEIHSKWLVKERERKAKLNENRKEKKNEQRKFFYYKTQAMTELISVNQILSSVVHLNKIKSTKI